MRLYNANLIHQVLFIVFCISINKAHNITIKGNSKIVSQLTIKTKNNIITSSTYNISLFNNEDFQQYLTRIIIETNNLCLMSYTSTSNESIVEYCLVSKEDHDPPLYITEEESLLSDIYYYSTNNNKTNTVLANNFSAVLFPRVIDSNVIAQSLSHPLFLISDSLYKTLMNIILLPKDSSQNDIGTDNITLSIYYDNTKSLLPFTYLSFSKYISILTSFLLASIILISKQKKFYKVVLFLSLLKLIYSALFFFLISYKLRYIDDTFNTGSISFENLFEILCGIINIIYLTVMYTLFLMTCSGWGIMYNSLSRNKMRKYYIIFIVEYIIISIDYLIDVININIIGFLSINIIKNLFMISIITIFSFRNLNYNIKCVSYKIIYALSYARNYYKSLNNKLITLKRLKKLIQRYFVCCLIALFLFCDYRESYYYQFIKKVDRENIECILSIVFVIIIGMDNERDMEFNDLLSDVTVLKRFGMYKWDCTVQSKLKIDNKHNKILKIPIIITRPFYDKEKVDDKDKIKHVMIGLIEDCE